MLSDEVMNGKVFTALKYTLVLVAMLEKGLQKKSGCFIQLIWTRETDTNIQKLPGESA